MTRPVIVAGAIAALFCLMRSKLEELRQDFRTHDRRNAHSPHDSIGRRGAPPAYDGTAARGQSDQVSYVCFVALFLPREKKASPPCMEARLPGKPNI